MSPFLFKVQIAVLMGNHRWGDELEDQIKKEEARICRAHADRMKEARITNQAVKYHIFRREGQGKPKELRF